MITPIQHRIAILAEIWLYHKDEDIYEELLSYADVAFPIAYAIDDKIVDLTSKAQEFIDEAWKMLLELLEVEDSGNFSSLEELTKEAEAVQERFDAEVLDDEDEEDD